MTHSVNVSALPPVTFEGGFPDSSCLSPTVSTRRRQPEVTEKNPVRMVSDTDDMKAFSLLLRSVVLH